MKRPTLALATACILALPTLVVAGEADIKKGVEAFLGSTYKVESVRKAGFLNLYEVVVGSDVLYTDEKVSYVLLGNVIDTKNHKDLTEDRKNKLAQIKFSDLPLDLAVKNEWEAYHKPTSR